MRFSGFLALVVVGSVVVACANGTTTTGFVDDDAGASTVIPLLPDDAGKDSTTDSSKDSGATTKDSGTKDSGSVNTNAADCTGPMSAQLTETYDHICDRAFFDGESYPCTSGGNDCAALDGVSGFTFCCYNPPAGSFCNDDYGGIPQCVPR